jgi:hypothetical protein
LRLLNVDDTMGSSQSRPNESKPHSKVGDQLKSVLRRPSPSIRENNNGDEVAKPHSKAVEVTNGKHDNKTPTPETEPTKASTVVWVLVLYMSFVAVLL